MKRLTMKDSWPHSGHRVDRWGPAQSLCAELSCPGRTRDSELPHRDRDNGPLRPPEQRGPNRCQMCQAQESGTVLSAGASVTRGPSRLHAGCTHLLRSHNPLSPLSGCVPYLFPMPARLSLPEAPPACHPLPSALGLALGPELWRIFADRQPRLTKAPAWGSPQEFPETALGEVRHTGSSSAFLPGPWTLHTMAP